MPSYQSSHTGAEHDQYVTKADLVDLIYPIGAIYISASSADPGLLFGGAWTQIEDKFLLCAGSTYVAGTSGGSASINLAHSHTTNAGTTGGHTLTTSEIPAHAHDMTHTVYNFGPNDGLTRNDSNGDSLLAQDNKGSGTASPFCRRSYGNTGNSGGGGAHTHPQTAVGTDSKLSSSQSILPPYLSVYVWQRTG